MHRFSCVVAALIVCLLVSGCSSLCPCKVPCGFKPVESSMIDGVKYTDATGELAILFDSGDIITYRNVPADKYAAFMAAESKGQFYHAEIKGQYERSPAEP